MSTSVSILTLLLGYKWYILSTVIVSWAFQSYRSYRRLSQVRGPWLAQFSNLWLLRAVYRQKTHLEFYKELEKHGSLVRVGPNTLITDDVDAINRISAARSRYVRSDWYLGFRLAPGVDNVFSMRDEKAHTKRRAQMNLAYTGKEDINFEPSIDVHASNFVNLIRSRYLSSGQEMKMMDLAEKAQFFTTDVITDLATGAAFGDLVNDRDQHDFLRTTGDFQPAMVLIGSVPAATKFIHIPMIGKMLFPSSEDEIGMGKMLGITQKQVADRFEMLKNGRNEKPDIIQSFINNGLNGADTVSESMLLIFGGSDTTASAVRATMLCILSSPRVYRRLQEEIDEAVASGKATRPVIRDEESRKLDFLQAVILEGLRMHPPAGGLLSKITPPEGDTIGGVFVPGGTSVGHCLWSVMRKQTLFGADSKVFRPERWLEMDEDEHAKLARVVDLAFGSGRFKCLGRTVALMELNKIFFELLYHFDWSIVDPTDPWKSANLGIIIHRNFNVWVTERRK